ncbi:hypothetical protein HQ585_16725 [candidate division KSB1 bacterium]|nr:hypothetical protein [candidate division KSB1 bacterium]
MKTRFIKNLFLLVIAILLQLYPSSVTADINVLANGDMVSWDGQYYDYRDAEGVKMIKLWIPPNTNPIRGVFISGHGGGGGDSRNFARDENIRAFAMRLGFSVAGLHNFPGRRVYNEGAKVFFYALDEFAKLGHHPEVAHLPFVMYGSSNGGASTYGFVNYAPERAICFLANVSAGYNPAEPVAEALKVPGIHIIGKFDALIGQRGIDRTDEMIQSVRPKGALWSWALELKGHEDGASFDVYMKLVEQAVSARYPKKGDPRNGPIKLKELKEKDGWLVDLDSWGNGLTHVDSYKNYNGDKLNAGWVLNKNMAYVYRSMATHHNPLSLKVREFDRTFNPHTDPGTMFSLGGPVAKPGEEITIVCNTENHPDWKKIEFFNGADKLGEVKSGNPPQIKTELGAQNQVYCLTALATDESGNQRTCAPMHFFVKDPSLKWHADLPKSVRTSPKTNAGSKNVGQVVSCTSPDPVDSVLVAYGLNAKQEGQFSAHDDKISEFWKLIGKNMDHVKLTQRRNAREDAAFNFVLTHDCNMTVKAAYGADGIYLLFEINDDNDVAWPNKFVATENEQFYLNFDVIDMLIDSRSIEEISSPENKDMFVSRSFGLTTTTRQYQIACGTEKERPSGFKRALFDPWDFHSTYFTFADAKKQLGIEVENIKTAPFHKAQEVFIPWSEYGSGFQSEPDTGTRMAFTAGFNDRDEGEHFPPGVTSSGGSIKASNGLRWIGKTDPWGSSKPTYAWGEIEIGAMLVIR